MGTKSEGQRVLGMVAYACNPSTLDADQENHEFQTTLSFIVRTCLDKTKQNNNKSKVFLS